ncbi:MAG: cytochrome c family protein [Candidatus Marinimicrobia bacterium]|nr:cytochrome c family protein [Candidatus Neomarinimicrobiota bacterium]
MYNKFIGTFLVLTTLGCFVSSIVEANDMLDAADVEIGEDLSMACTACHSFVKDDPTPVKVVTSISDVVYIGPNLYGVYKRKIGTAEDYAYSDALVKEKEAGRVWTVDKLDEWIKSPMTFVKGTYMPFNGLLDPQDRADVIAYLMTLKDTGKKL